MAIKIAGQEVITNDRRITGGVSLDLTPIEATIADTAVDVFVYDTRKDSDGGAWRKRTQHTSWYNETLNTATRGSRKEFPAVAVIVATGSPDYEVTIYDGDDPDLPMWMVFQNYNARPTYVSIGTGDNGSPTVGGIAMLNGELCVGTRGSTGSAGSWDGLFRIDFVSEELRHHSLNSSYSIYSGSGIVDRNSAGYNNAGVIGNYKVVNTQINDVAMTVLPNAPIDPATQLPIPTIAVATEGGVSVIKDDGSVVDITRTNASMVYDLGFQSDNTLIVMNGGAGGVWRSVPIPTSDLIDNDYGGILIGKTSIPGTLDYSLGTDNYVEGTDYVALGQSEALYRMFDKDNIAYITSTYNTGWMNGDIKLATLSDTDATPATAYDHSGITFRDSGRIASHTYVTGATTWTVTDDTNNATEGYFGLTIPVVDGETYTISHTRNLLLTGTAQNHIQFVDDDNSFVNYGNGQTDYNDSITFVARGSFIRWVTYSRNDATTTHTIYVSKAEKDRSINGNGLQVFGTVNKTPVATGADLVAYSGFSVDNYLSLPDNNNIDAFSTSDFHISTWIKVTGHNTWDAICAKDHWDASKRFIFAIGAGGTSGAISFAGDQITSTKLPINTWTLVSVVRRGNMLYGYYNGVQVGTLAWNSSYSTDTNNNLSIGVRHANDGSGTGGPDPLAGSLALFRISATAPTPEQIAKIYEDEKVLFQEGAQATLYGTSDAVTALAYDDTTDLLHVGTSSGRSSFSGLKRVDNTTTGVTTAISASNEMIVEQ